MWLRTKVAALVVGAVLAATAATAAIGYSSARSLVLRDLERGLKATAEVQGERLESELEHYRDQVTLLTSRTALRRFAASPDRPGARGAIERVLDDVLSSTEDFTELSVVGIDGTVLASTRPERVGESVTGEQWFARGSEGPRIGEFFLAGDEVRLNLAGPLLYEGRTVGVVHVVSRASRLVAITGEFAEFGRTGEALLGERLPNGDAVFLTANRFDPAAALRSGVPGDDLRIPMNIALLGREGFMHGIDYRGQEVLAVTGFIEPVGWGLVMKVDSAEAFAPLIALRDRFLAVGVVATISVALGALLLARRVTRPLVSLTDVAQAIRRGETARRAQPRRNDELGVLGNAFNEMANSLLSTQEQLIEVKNFLANILESSTEYSIIAEDLDRRALSWNEGARRNYGYKDEEVIGRPSDILRASGELSSDAAGGLYRRALERGVAEGVLRSRRKDGSEFTASVVITRRNGPDGAPVGFLIVSRDITEELRLRELTVRSRELEQENLAMREANRLKSELLANMSHELRTPLNSIIGFAELLASGKVGSLPSEHRELIRDIVSSGRHLLSLVSALLDFAKVEAGRMEFHPEPLHLDRVANEVVATLRPLWIEKDMHVAVEIDPAAAEVELDGTRLRQVLYNLVSNAVKFTPASGHVWVRAAPEPEGDRFRLEVEDDGIGIAAENMHRLFIAFEQIDSGMAKRYAGTGLGLAVTKRIVEAQGGTIDVVSEVGKGSVFSVHLPRRFPISHEGVALDHEGGPSPADVGRPGGTTSTGRHPCDSRLALRQRT